MSYIKDKDYSEVRKRPKPLTHYVAQMTAYLKAEFPQVSQDKIEDFVKNTVREKMQVPDVEAIVHPKEGVSEVKTTKLDYYITKVIADNNLSPSGSCYHPISRKESFLRMSIDDKVKARSKFKKIYLSYEEQGMKRESQYYYQNQANAKIFNNAIAGGMCLTQFILGCRAGFNAITSTGRISVKQGYSFIERAVNSNIYLPTVNDALDYVLNHVRHIPQDFSSLINDNILYIPTSEQVFQYLLTSLKNYVYNPKTSPLEDLLTRLSDIELSYVFYAGSFNNLCRFNESLMRSWIDSCFLPQELDPSLYAHIDLNDIKKYADDVQACILSTNYKRLGPHPTKKGKWNSPRDAASHNPEGLKAFIYCCEHFTKNFEKLLHVIRPIMHVNTSFSKLHQQHRLARYTVPLSDTDSNIFSTQELIRWKRGQIDFSQEAYEMNALTTFILSQSLEHVFARLSAGFGAEGKDVFRISMKNEFLYPVLIATALGKHYIAIATMQEGALLPNPRKDIKGIGLRSSTYPRPVRDKFEAYMESLVNQIQTSPSIRASSILKEVASLEVEIYESIKRLEPTYLQTVSIKNKDEYKDPLSSQYFYYELWKYVFEETYGEMVIPNKCYKIPLITGEKLFKNVDFLKKLHQEQPKIHDRLLEFMLRYPDRDISALLIPPFKGNMHQFFVEIMDIRSHISQIMMGYYHVLNAFGIGTVDPKQNGLVSDFYNPALKAIDA